MLSNTARRPFWTYSSSFVSAPICFDLLIDWSSITSVKLTGTLHDERVLPDSQAVRDLIWATIDTHVDTSLLTRGKLKRLLSVNSQTAEVPKRFSILLGFNSIRVLEERLGLPNLGSIPVAETTNVFHLVRIDFWRDRIGRQHLFGRSAIFVSARTHTFINHSVLSLSAPNYNTLIATILEPSRKLVSEIFTRLFSSLNNRTFA